MRKQDFGVNNKTFIVKTHLGMHLKHNDSVLGYDIEALNMAEIDEVKHIYKDQHPDLVIVKKHYPKYRKKLAKRYWKLKHMPREEDEEMQGVEVAEEGAKPKKQKKGKRLQGKKEQNQKDYEDFL